jgi:hypothetical protein
VDEVELGRSGQSRQAGTGQKRPIAKGSFELKLMIASAGLTTKISVPLRLEESVGTAWTKGRRCLVVDYLLTGKTAHYRRQSDSRMHRANVHAADIG